MRLIIILAAEEHLWREAESMARDKHIPELLLFSIRRGYSAFFEGEGGESRRKINCCINRVLPKT